MFGEISEGMRVRLKEILQGKEIWALGAGPDLHEAWVLLSLGAKRVWSVDKSQRFLGSSTNKVQTGSGYEILDFRGYFEEFFDLKRGEDNTQVITFLKWPQTNFTPGLIDLLGLSQTVVYVGKNDGATACGSPQLWGYLSRRELQEEIQSCKNDMLVYGGVSPIEYPPRCREEEEAPRF